MTLEVSIALLCMAIGIILFFIFRHQENKVMQTISIKVGGKESLIKTPANRNSYEERLLSNKLFERSIELHSDIRSSFYNLIGDYGKMEITLYDCDGKEALISETIKYKSTKNDNFKYEKMLFADGKIKDVKISNFEHEIIDYNVKNGKKGKLLKIDFGNLKKDQEIKFKIEYSLINSFSRPEDYWKLTFPIPFNKYTVHINFPEECPCIKSKLIKFINLKEVNETTYTPDKDMPESQNIVYEINEIKNTEDYMFEWEW